MSYTLNATDADCYKGTTVLINKYELFSELYEWAGSIRTIPLSKSVTIFTAPEKIESLGDAIFKRLKECNYYVGTDRNTLIKDAADLYDSLNRLHPFREGNGRTERIFFSQLIRHAGYDINFTTDNAELLMIGSIQAASGVMDNLVRFFDENITE